MQGNLACHTWRHVLTFILNHCVKLRHTSWPIPLTYPRSLAGDKSLSAESQDTQKQQYYHELLLLKEQLYDAQVKLSHFARCGVACPNTCGRIHSGVRCGLCTNKQGPQLKCIHTYKGMVPSMPMQLC